METGRNSYTRIPNQLLSAVCSFSLSLNEVRLLLAIGRLSYGWSAEDTAGRASMKELQNITGLQANQLYVAIKGLKNKKVLLVTGGKQNTYRINACVDQWESAANCHKDKTAEGDESLPKSVTIRDQNQSRIVTKTSHESLPKSVTNRDQN